MCVSVLIHWIEKQRCPGRLLEHSQFLGTIIMVGLLYASYVEEDTEKKKTMKSNEFHFIHTWIVFSAACLLPARKSARLRFEPVDPHSVNTLALPILILLMLGHHITFSRLTDIQAY